MNPIVILLGLGALVWAFSEARKAVATVSPQNATNGNLKPRAEKGTGDAGIPVRRPITVEMMREIFHGGARALTRRDAVELLKAAPYFVPKTNAYRALAPSRRFSAYLWEDKQGWLHFRA